jgi:hypothetical protein
MERMNQVEILQKVAAGELTAAEAAAMFDAAPARGLSYKVSEKGALSVYGVGRFPLTAYLQTWEKLDSDEERGRRAAFIEANRAKFSVK